MHPVVLAADFQPGNVVSWLGTNIVPILIVLVGISVMAQWKHGKLSKIMGQVGVMILGLGIIAGAAIWSSVAGGLVSKFFG